MLGERPEKIPPVPAVEGDSPPDLCKNQSLTENNPEIQLYDEEWVSNF
jgi:hypothetical protein